MRFKEAALLDNPVNLYIMNTAGSLSDWSGYGNTATMSGVSSAHPSVTSGANHARYFYNSNKWTFSTPVFRQGDEDRAFSLEAWFRTQADTTHNQVLGHDGESDGLYINGTVVYFSVRYTDGTEDRVSFDNQKHEVIHAVAVKTEAKLSLYVNGDLVDETDASQGKTYLSTDTALCSGTQTSGNGILVSAIAVYNNALDGVDIEEHFDAGIMTSDADDIASEFGALHVPFASNPSAVFDEDDYWDTESWGLGLASNVSMQGEIIRPMMENGYSVAGIWQTSFNIEQAGTNISGVQADWDGVGFTVEASINGGSTWSAMTKGVNTGLISSNYDPTGKNLLVRVVFPGGIQNDQSFIRRLTIRGFRATAPEATEGMSFTATTYSPRQEMISSIFHQDWGAVVTGTLTLVNNQEVDVRTVEIWMRPISGAVTLPSGYTHYVNGVASSTVPGGFWSLVHLVSSTSVTANIPIVTAGTLQVGSANIYEESMTAARVTAIIANYSDTDVISVTENSNVAVDSLSEAAQVYSHQWFIQPAG